MSGVASKLLDDGLIRSALDALEAGRLTSVDLVEASLGRIEDAVGQGASAFTRVYRQGALAAAARQDALRAGGRRLPLGGLPISIKDLFDVAGETTTAGSIVLGDAAPASRDAAIVARLRRAGAVIVGKTNMSEFAFSGLGGNPHYGVPLAPYDRARGRVAGGSSSGAAVSVADGMALGAVGSDTGGSVRIPAAFCGLTGFKPTRGRVPTDGTFPLARSFDVVGPIARTVDDCRRLDAVLSAAGRPSRPRPARGLRLAVVAGLPVEGLDPLVAAAFAGALSAIEAGGAQLVDLDGIDWGAAITIAQSGRISAVECLAAHGALFDRAADYDPRVATRIRAAQGFPATDYARALADLEALRRRVLPRLRSVDAVLMPTVASLPPRVSDLAQDDAFFTANSLALRNTMLANLLDACAVSLPMTPRGEAPAGLMLVAARGRDQAVLDAAETVEAILAGRAA